MWHVYHQGQQQARIPLHTALAHTCNTAQTECPAGIAAVLVFSFFKSLRAPNKSMTQTAFAKDISLMVIAVGSDTSISLLGMMIWSE